MSFDKQRFRSFVERYLIERASTFQPGKEREDAWLCVQDAKTIYANIEATADVEADMMNVVPPSGAGRSNWQGYRPPTNPRVIITESSIYKRSNP
jgi:hypothetical protein